MPTEGSSAHVDCGALFQGPHGALCGLSEVALEKLMRSIDHCQCKTHTS